MNFKAVITFIYAAIILAGGMMGYIKAQSLPSLIMGTTFALLLTLSAIGILKDYLLGQFIAAGLAGLLALFFSYRFFQTMSFMPAGLIVILSLIVIFLLLRK